MLSSFGKELGLESTLGYSGMRRADTRAHPRRLQRSELQRADPAHAQSPWARRAAWFTHSCLLLHPQCFCDRVVCKPRCQTSCPGDPQRSPGSRPASPGQEERARGSLTPPPSPPRRQEFLRWADGPPPRPPPVNRSGWGGEDLRDFPASRPRAQGPPETEGVAGAQGARPPEARGAAAAAVPPALRRALGLPAGPGEPPGWRCRCCRRCCSFCCWGRRATPRARRQRWAPSRSSSGRVSVPGAAGPGTARRGPGMRGGCRERGQAGSRGRRVAASLLSPESPADGPVLPPDGP